MFDDLLAKAVSGLALTREEAREAGRELLSGGIEPLRVAAFLGALAAAGETEGAVAGLVESLRDEMVPFPAFPDAVDTCGTGGDRAGTFNLSTAAAVAVAALGVPVAKHGNRSVSSACGSADLLEAAGYPVPEEAELGAARLRSRGFAFLFAPAYHPALAAVGPVRRTMGVRTTFNLLGPLLNPAGVHRQVVGVYAHEKMHLVAGALGALGTERALVLFGRPGLGGTGTDEAVLHGLTDVLEVTPAGIEAFTIAPEDAGMERAGASALAGGDPQRNLKLFRSLLFGTAPEPLRNAVALNAALVLRAAGAGEDLKENAGRVLEALGTGAVGRFWEALLAPGLPTGELA